MRAKISKILGITILVGGIFSWTPGVFAAVENSSIASSYALPTLPAHYAFTQKITFTNHDNAAAYDVTAHVVLLAPETSYSQVKLLHESVSPVRVYHDQYGNLIGTFIWPELAPHQTVSLFLRYAATSSDVSYRLPTTYQAYDTKSALYKQYTNPQLESSEVNTDSPVLENIDRSVIKPGENPEQEAHGLFEWIVDNIHYNYTLKASGSAVATAESHLGICSDIADLYVGLLRTAKIPARFVGGYVTSNGSGQGGFHQWTEFYLPKVGWVVADPTWGAYGYFAALQDHWHIALYDGIRKDITVEWNYAPATLTQKQAATQISIDYHYVFHTAMQSPASPPAKKSGSRKTKGRPLLEPSTLSHKNTSKPLNVWQTWWLVTNQWIRQTENHAGSWVGSQWHRLGF